MRNYVPQVNVDGLRLALVLACDSQREPQQAEKAVKQQLKLRGYSSSRLDRIRVSDHRHLPLVARELALSGRYDGLMLLVLNDDFNSRLIDRVRFEQRIPVVVVNEGEPSSWVTAVEQILEIANLLLLLRGGDHD